MEFKSLLRRAKRGLREDAKLYGVAISSLTVAFLCLSTLLLAVVNLGSFAERWGRTHRMSVYLRDDAQNADVDRLRLVLSALPGVAQVEHLSAAAARESFLRESLNAADLTGLPADVFPASLEVEFATDASDARIQEVAAQVSAFKTAVADVDTYRSWFERLSSLLTTGRAAALVVGLLVLICVFAVVSNTIRLALASRRDEIEMLKMCGATDSFVRGPFVVEGALQGFLSALVSVVLLLTAYLLLRGQINAALVPMLGMRLSFLSPVVVVSVLVSGALTGALGSALSIRRYMSV
ncbi:MAG: permease-like cell division protein FtsX [Myxococcales bacterium]